MKLTYVCENCSIILPKRKDYSYNNYYFCSEKCQLRWIKKQEKLGLKVK
jgi:hypothetical protein